MIPPITTLWCKHTDLAVGDELRRSLFEEPVVILSIDPPTTPGGDRRGSVRPVDKPDALPSGVTFGLTYQVTGGPKLTAARKDQSLVKFIPSTGKHWWTVTR